MKKKYLIRIKTEEEFRKEQRWINAKNVPIGWNSHKLMNYLLGQTLQIEKEPNSLNIVIQDNKAPYYNWYITTHDCILLQELLNIPYYECF